jgi:DNA-binding beta-propeller fold protein YncE
MMPNGQTLYVAEWGSAQVQEVYTALSPTTPNTVKASVTVGAGSQPISISLSPNGCLAYVSDWPSDHVFSIVTSTNTEATAFTLNCQTQDPQPMEVTPDNLYLFLPGNYSCSSFSAYNTSTKATTVIGGVGTYPAMVAIPPEDEWYRITATHGLWSSDPSPPTTLPGVVALYAPGFNPGGWQ